MTATIPDVQKNGPGNHPRQSGGDDGVPDRRRRDPLLPEANALRQLLTNSRTSRETKWTANVFARSSSVASATAGASVAAEIRNSRDSSEI
jgi:hypothetical protein